MVDRSAATEESTDVPVPAPMRVSRVEVENFRLLSNVSVALDDTTTVLVGRNNTGKTSLAEVLSRFFSPKDLRLSIADFSSEIYDSFLEAYGHFIAKDEAAARDALPSIRLSITVAYSREQKEFGPLAALIVDLDPTVSTAIVEFTYKLKGGLLADFFADTAPLGDGKTPTITELLSVVGARIPGMFERSISAVDPTDPTNTRPVSLDAVRSLISVDLLNAQRGLDDEKERPTDLIGSLFESLFTAASKADASTERRDTAENLRSAVSEIESRLGDEIETMVAGVIPTLQEFGYPGLGSQNLATQTKLDIEKILSNYTSVHYEGVAGISLPESYSGLGSRNLLLILLTLLSYYRAFTLRAGAPGVHLIFVEEPEAHLHPQMQEVFIHQLSALKKLFPEIDRIEEQWAAQFVVSTHSSHVANRAPFSAIRYFRLDSGAEASTARHTDVLDLSKAKDMDAEFLHQYLTLTRSDLFFADKAILVEGTSERLIVPRAVEKTEPAEGEASASSQYVTILEVGGAYAHLFFPLLDFIGLPSLVITDIDSVGPAVKGTRSSSPVHVGDRTSNATIKNWFANKDVTPSELIELAKTDQIVRGNRYLAYQVPEESESACGRTFEDAFILANQTMFEFVPSSGDVETENKAADLAKAQKKSEFALTYSISKTDWDTPRYIARGLEWLLSNPTIKSVGAPAAEPKAAVK
ncbi:ATP-dependent endonuclease [Salinibacterium sp. SWN167]|uniref:ATP-dependent nuclease n=1 Tax=Salinibacterium sp. SWN167 TaxID=2792054 RepID=UPI0018CD9120|nr:ATP-dependent endonuclease [Salinibacterium sp. SWN167]MBH0083137.1 AAA family ATPase [Salinibacterium sp. SWN167]